MKKYFYTLFVLCLFSVHSSADILDEIAFGSFVSEFSHNTTLTNASGGTGGLGQTFRKLNNYNPARDYGGTISFDVQVDPVKQNYITLKLWGSDYCTTARSTILYLYYEGKQLGYRDYADWTPLDGDWEEPEFPDRFYYTTYILPLSMTQGKTSIRLTIESWGYWWPYGGTWDECQKLQEEPSRGIYKAYTHTENYFEPPQSEIQGNPIPLGDPRPSPGGGMTVLDKLIDDADSIVGTRKLSSVPLGSWKLIGLARAYNSDWSVHYRDPVILNKVVDDFDYWVSQVAKSTDKTISDDNHDDWMGYGRMAMVLLDMIDHFDANGLMSVLIDHDNDAATADISRIQAYAEFFRDGRDWRMLDRRYITNQVLDCEISIYLANKALQRIEPTMAWDESYAIQTVYEAVGLMPYGTWEYDTYIDTSRFRQQILWNSQWPYYMITSKGLSRETGYVAYYGNVSDALARLYKYSGDESVKQKAIQFVEARAPFRFTSNDDRGYRAMRIEAAIGTRHINQTGHVQYGDWSGFETAAVLQDPVSVRLAQLYLQDNRVWVDDIDIEDEVQRVNDYLTVASLPQSDYRFPLEPNQPDFAWADEENCVIAAKKGSIKFNAVLYFRLTPVINKIGRVHYTTPIIDRVANISIDCNYTPLGEYLIRADNPAHPDQGRKSPPQALNIHSYHGGESMPTAVGALPGRAEFYHFEYADFLVGMNTTEDKDFTLPVPEGSPAEAIDMISGQVVNLQSDPVIGPKSTMLLYLAEPVTCGDVGTIYLEADFNKDCIVDFYDFAIMAQNWLD